MYYQEYLRLRQSLRENMLMAVILLTSLRETTNRIHLMVDSMSCVVLMQYQRVLM